MIIGITLNRRKRPLRTIGFTPGMSVQARLGPPAPEACGSRAAHWPFLGALSLRLASCSGNHSCQGDPSRSASWLPPAPGAQRVPRGRLVPWWGTRLLCPGLATEQAPASAGHHGRPCPGRHLQAACGKHRFFCFSWNSLYPRETESGQSCSLWKCHMCFPIATGARMLAPGAAAPSPHPTHGIAFTPPT